MITIFLPDLVKSSSNLEFWQISFELPEKLQKQLDTIQYRMSVQVKYNLHLNTNIWNIFAVIV